MCYDRKPLDEDIDKIKSYRYITDIEIDVEFTDSIYNTIDVINKPNIDNSNG